MKPHNRTRTLPIEPNDFVGRERDVTDLDRMLEGTRCVTLCGPGGIGKTRLALHVARRFAGGVGYVELDEVERDGAGRAPDAVAASVAAVLGIAPEPGREPTATITDALQGEELLLLLDNCEHLVEQCAAFAAAVLAACPDVRLLATSREPLRMPGENVWRVPPLSVPPAAVADPDRHEAVRLFLGRARAVRPGFELTDANTAAVAAVCRSLDGLPLALELAAARVRVLSVEQIAERLADRFRLLTTASRTAPPRQRTLRTAVDWSYELLDGPERTLLNRLSVFAGWTLEQAERVCADGGLPGAAVLDLTTALVDKSLIAVDRELVGRTRYRMLESIRDYAAERLAAAGEENLLHDRHREAVLEELEYDAEVGLAEREATWAERAALFDKYDHELGNVRAALAWSLRRRDTEDGLRLCTALRIYQIPRGGLGECDEWLGRFLALGERGVSDGVLGGALVARAEALVEQRLFTEAEGYGERALPLCRRAGDPAMTAAALTMLASADAAAQRFEEGFARTEEAVGLARGAGDRWGEGLALIARGALQVAAGRLREAQETLGAGQAVMRAADQQWGVTRASLVLAVLARLRGDHAAARDHYEQALPILRGIRADPDTARCLGGIGRTALEAGDLPAARAALAESLVLGRAAGLRAAVVRSLDAFAALTAREGDERLAVRLAGAAAALRDALGMPPRTGARLEKVLVPVRRHLGEQAVAVLWGQGRSLTMGEAVTAALGAGPAEPFGDLASAVVTPPSTLTPRETELVRLIARGLSNKAIADELVISPATVARHVTNMLTKLGFTSRAQIAAWAVEHGLAGDA